MTTESEGKTPERVWATFTRKVNLGNYESMDLSVGYSRDLLPDEDRETTIVEMSIELKEQVEFLLETFDTKS